MAEDHFENDLPDLFAQPPAALVGHADFLAAVEAKLERGWTLRRWLVGGLGAAGGVLAASQWIPAALRIRSDGASLGEGWHAFTGHLAAMASAPANAIGAPVETLYISAALAIVALALGIGRLVREI